MDIKLSSVTRYARTKEETKSFMAVYNKLKTGKIEPEEHASLLVGFCHATVDGKEIMDNKGQPAKLNCYLGKKGLYLKVIQCEQKLGINSYQFNYRAKAQIDSAFTDPKATRVPLAQKAQPSLFNEADFLKTI